MIYLDEMIGSGYDGQALLTLSSYTDLVRLQTCFPGKVPGGSLPVEEVNSAWRETKSLYRRETVHVRIGVDTDRQYRSWARAVKG